MLTHQGSRWMICVPSRRWRGPGLGKASSSGSEWMRKTQVQIVRSTECGMRGWVQWLRCWVEHTIAVVIDLGGLGRDAAAARASFQGLSLVVHLWPATREVRRDSIPFKIRCQMMSSPSIMHQCWGCHVLVLLWVEGNLEEPGYGRRNMLAFWEATFCIEDGGVADFCTSVAIAYAFRVLKS